ncbi:hypothetical protein JTB14_007364 [Gonioctena quinquepunctata]|nr:hypothetical protein JTB14_007364 [Gonioctena quinquepunctata]
MFIVGLSNQAIKEKLLQEESLNLDKAIKIAKAIEITQLQARNLNKNTEVVVAKVGRSAHNSANWQKSKNSHLSNQVEGICHRQDQPEAEWAIWLDNVVDFLESIDPPIRFENGSREEKGDDEHEDLSVAKLLDNEVEEDNEHENLEEKERHLQEYIDISEPGPSGALKREKKHQ